MSSSASNSTTEEQKKFKHEDFSLVNKDIININNSINDDCFICIFKHLSFIDKLNIELVCKKWNSLAKNSWSNVKSLKICKKLISQYQNVSDSKCLNFIMNILKRCSSYLNFLLIKNDLDVDYKVIITEIKTNCFNLISLRLIDYHVLDQRSGDDDDLSMIFRNNTQLSNIYINDLLLTGDCLLNLNAEKIKEIAIYFCNFESNNYLNFFSKLKNMKKFHIHIYNENDSIIKAIYESGAEKVEEFDMWGGDESFTSQYFIEFLMKQKFLKKLAIRNFTADKQVLEILPASIIQDLAITIDESTSFFLKWYENLVSLDCKIVKVTNLCIKNLAKCLNLKKLRIWMTVNDLTSEGENYFSEFKKLESFSLHFNKKNIDNIFKAVVKCKNLTEINVGDCKFTKIILKNILQVPDLKILNVSSTYITNKQLKIIVIKLLKLEKIDVDQCECIGYECLETLSNIKIYRNDQHSLKIYTSDDSDLGCELIENNVGLEPFPLIKVKIKDAN